MQLAKDIKNDIKAAKKIWLPWWGVLCVMIGAVPALFLFDYLGKPALALPTLLAIAVIVFAIVLKWQLRMRVWFWVTMTVIVALHVLLILSVPWTTKWVPAAVFAGFGSVDLCGMLAILNVIGKFMEGPKTSER